VRQTRRGDEILARIALACTSERRAENDADPECSRCTPPAMERAGTRRQLDWNPPVRESVLGAHPVITSMPTHARDRSSASSQVAEPTVLKGGRSHRERTRPAVRDWPPAAQEFETCPRRGASFGVLSGASRTGNCHPRPGRRVSRPRPRILRYWRHASPAAPLARRWSTLRGALVLQRAANDRGRRAVTLNSLARRRLRAAASPRPSGREPKYRFGGPEQLEVTFFGAMGAYGSPAATPGGAEAPARMGFGAAMESRQAIASIELEDEESGKLKVPHGPRPGVPRRGRVSHEAIIRDLPGRARRLVPRVAANRRGARSSTEGGAREIVLSLAVQVGLPSAMCN
jgi:hypothetical protein